MQNQGTAQQHNQVIYRIKETARLTVAARVAHTGNLPHAAVVFGLPIRDDGKIYTGQVTFTASL
jgi:hypothetical protein